MLKIPGYLYWIPAMGALDSDTPTYEFRASRCEMFDSRAEDRRIYGDTVSSRNFR